MKTRLIHMALATLLLLSSCAVSETPPHSPQYSPSPREPSASPELAYPSETPGQVVVLPSDTEPPTANPSVSPSASPTPTSEPAGASQEPSPEISPSQSPSPKPSTPPQTFSGRVVPELPELTFEIHSEPYGNVYTAHHIIVRNGGELYQEIDLGEYSTEQEGITCASQDMDFLLEDMNYDGCRDFRVRDYVTSTPNNQFLTFLWDSAGKSFVFSPELSALTNPEFDEANQFVHSRIVLLPDILESSFTFDVGELMLQAETRRHLDAERSVWLVTVSMRLEGVMTVTDQYEEEYDGSI